MQHFLKTTAIALAASTSLAFTATQAAELSKEIGDAPAASGNYTITELAGGLSTPWSLAFLPNGDMLVTEKTGKLRVMRDGALLKKPVDGVPEVFVKSQSGLFDVVLHPDYEQNSLIYLAYTHKEGRRNTLRLARARFTADDEGGSLQDFEVLFTADAWRTTGHHYGGRIVFLPDGTLLLTSGDGGRHREDAQKLNTHFGKIIRLNDDGSVPADNPFVGQDGALPEIWSYGHRNPQGLVYDAENDIVYSHEHGPRGGDEVNIVKKGKNYGWPAICYCIDYTGAQITPFSELEGMEQSAIHYVPSIAPSGFALYKGEAFPDWNGDLFIGALAFRHVRHIDMENGDFGEQQKLLIPNELEQSARIRDVRSGPDGYLYVLTDGAGGKVYQVKPE